MKHSAKENLSIIVGNNLKIERLKKSALIGETITQGRVCKEAGIHPSQLAHYESGRRVPSLSIFIKLCRYYHVAPEKILEINMDDIGAGCLYINKGIDKNKEKIVSLNKNLKPIKV